MFAMDDLLTTKQLMELLQVDRTTIYRMLNDGRLPAVRVGGQYRFSRLAIDAWLENKLAMPLVALGSTLNNEMHSADEELLPMYCLQPVQEVFAQSNEIGAVTTDTNGKPMTPFSNVCAYCNLILTSAKGRARCEASWKKLATHNLARPHLERCHAGLTYARGRVVVANQFVAMCFAGQFLVADGSPLASETIRQVATACEVDPVALKQVAAEIHVFDKLHADRLLYLLQLLAETFSRIGQERHDLVQRLRRVAEIAATPS